MLDKQIQVAHEEAGGCAVRQHRPADHSLEARDPGQSSVARNEDDPLPQRLTDFELQRTDAVPNHAVAGRHGCRTAPVRNDHPSVANERDDGTLARRPTRPGVGSLSGAWVGLAVQDLYLAKAPPL